MNLAPTHMNNLYKQKTQKMTNLTADKLMNAEADRFLDDLNQSGYLAFRFYQKVNSLNIEETVKSTLDSWLDTDLNDITGTTYSTDTDHLISRIEVRLNTSLDMWKGHYRLASNNGQVFNLNIAGPSKNAPNDSEKNRVFINGVKILDYTFENKVLSWERSDAKIGSTKGELKFQNFADQNFEVDLSTVKYNGPVCEGKVIMSNGLDEISVKGKVGVFSAAAILGDYGHTDNLDFWVGTHALYAINESKEEISIGNLVIQPKKDGQKTRVLFNEEPIHEAKLESGTLVWLGKKNSNKTSAKITLFETIPGEKRLNGSIRLPSAKHFVDTFGFQTIAESEQEKQEKLKIPKIKLPIATVGQKYQFQLVAEGGTPNYKWEIKNLPKTGFPAETEASKENLANGYIEGKPEAAGIIAVNIKVTDSSNPSVSVSKSLVLKIKEGTKAPAKDDIKAWITPVFSPVGYLIAAGLAIWGKIKFTKWKEDRDKANKIEENRNPAVNDAERLGDAEVQNAVEQAEQEQAEAQAGQAENMQEIVEHFQAVNARLAQNLADVIQRLEDAEARDREALEEEAAELEREVRDNGAAEAAAARQGNPEAGEGEDGHEQVNPEHGME